MLTNGWTRTGVVAGGYLLALAAGWLSTLVLLNLLGLAQLLGVPVWTAGFVLFAFLAPTRPARRLLIAAVGTKLVIAVCAAIHWFGPRT